MRKFNLRGFAVSLLGFIVSGCATSPRVTNKPVDEYVAYLRTHPGADLSGAKERQAKAAFSGFLENLTEQNVRENTPKVYAEKLFFNDTLKTLHTSTEIKAYFLKTLAGVDYIDATVQDVGRSGHDYYFRWIMETKLKSIQRGQTIRSIGISHVRFNSAGQVILHQDYWDSASGLFQHVPVIGGGIGLIKSRF